MGVRERDKIETFTRKIKEVEKNCPVCGKTFWGRKSQTYCDDPPLVCKNKAAYDRHAEKRQAERREKYRQQKDTSAKKKQAPN